MIFCNLPWLNSWKPWHFGSGDGLVKQEGNHGWKEDLDRTKGAGKTVGMALGTMWPGDDVGVAAQDNATQFIKYLWLSRFPLSHHNTPICFSLVLDRSRVLPSTLYMEHGFCITPSWYTNKTHIATREKLKMHYPPNILSVCMPKNPKHPGFL